MLALTEVERRLPLPVDQALLDRLAAEAAPRHPDYEIRTAVGPVPVDLRASYVELDNLLLVEMPHGDLDLEAGRQTVADLEAFDRELAGGADDGARLRGPRRRVAGFSDASVPGGGEGHLDQSARWSTPPTAATGSGWR